jgi:hypothetical protein
MLARAPRHARRSVHVLTVFVGGAVGFVGYTASAQPKATGELWRQSMSMEMRGMQMPGQTSEVCVPKGKEKESAGLAGRSDCRIYDTQQSGTRFAAKFECRGKEPMSGSMETIQEGDRIRGTMTVQSDGEKMTMRYDMQRLGKACEVPQAPPVVAAAPSVPGKGMCATMDEQLLKEPQRVGELAMHYVGKSASCGAPPQNKTFCSVVNSPVGYLELKRGEAQVESMKAGGGIDAETLAQLGMPLADSMRTCGLGSGPEAVAKLVASLQPGAREKGAWDFLVLEGDEASQAFLRDTAKAQCSGRSFTTAREPRYQGLCGPYGLQLVRGDVAAARELAIAARGGAEDSGTGAAAASSGETPPPAEEAPSATKDLLKKGRGVLRGILGGP